MSPRPRGGRSTARRWVSCSRRPTPWRGRSPSPRGVPPSGRASSTSRAERAGPAALAQSAHWAERRPRDKPRDRPPDREETHAVLAPALDTVRLTLHVLAATVWVGGQIVMMGLVGPARGLGGDAP